ncbi:MAG TPA: M20 family metallopeptidase [Silvibacterium sp.]|nr:M20 family metallopeptidase [Silvibacterium sp.]
MNYEIKNLLDGARHREKSLLGLLRGLVELESPSENKAAVDRCLEFTAEAAAGLGARIRRHRMRRAGDILELSFGSEKRGRNAAKPVLLLGHLDTVWPLGTLTQMPFKIEKGRAWGPGVLDMKAGVAMALTALDLLRSEGLLTRPVVLLLVGDEETGSNASRAITENVASRCERVYVLEPAQGLAGAYKTARKGVANYRVQVAGVAAHSGVNFADGHSAIAELARQVGMIEACTDLKRGITVNVGTIQGGTRSNVIAAEAAAEVDARIARMADFASLDRRFKNLRVHDKGCVLKMEGGLNRPPMERTRATVALYRRAAALAATMGFELPEAATGGGSDGNFTSALGVPTLDGMGAVGEGAHAQNESILLRELAPRTALLAAMMCER